MKYKIIKKIIKQNYIIFELNGYVRFNDISQKNIYCINEYPFTNYQKNEEIEIDRSVARKINANTLINDQQGVITKNYSSTWNPYIDCNQEESSKDLDTRRGMMQDTITLSAHDKKVVYDLFYMTIEWLEKYIEIACKNQFPDWENRKQIRDNLTITRTDIYNNPEKAKKAFSTQMFLFGTTLEDSPIFRDDLKKEFRQWIGSTRIDNSCPNELKHLLYGFDEIMDGNIEKIRKDMENRKREIEIDSPKYLEQMSKLFSNTQVPMYSERETQKSLVGKTHLDMEFGNRFGSDNTKQGEQTFQQIASSVSASHGSDFHFYPQNQSVSFDARQYDLTLKKLNGQIPLEGWETREGLLQWVNQLERSQQQAQQVHYDWDLS